MRAREPLLVLLSAALLVLAWTWPLAAELGRALPQGWATSAWRLWWFDLAVEQRRPLLWTSAWFWPRGRPLTPEEIALLDGALAQPLVSAAGAVTAAGALGVALPALGLAAAYALLRACGAGRGGAALAAAGWALSPLARAAWERDLALAVAPWSALALLALARSEAAPRRLPRSAWSAACGALLGVALLAAWPLAPALVLLVVLLVALGRGLAEEPSRVGLRAPLAWCALLAALAPSAWLFGRVVLELRAARGTGPWVSAAEALGAGGAAGGGPRSPVPLALVLLAGIACLRSSRARVLVVAAAPPCLAAWLPPLRGWLAPALGDARWVPPPAAWLLVAGLPLALAASLGWRALGARRLPQAALLALLALELRPRPVELLEGNPPPAVRALAGALAAQGSVLVLPLRAEDPAARIWQIAHGAPQAIGPLAHLEAARFAAWSRAYGDLAALALGGRAPEPELVSLDLEALGVEHVLVDPERAPDAGDLARVLDAMERWQRGPQAGDLLWWHRSALAYVREGARAGR